MILSYIVINEQRVILIVKQAIGRRPLIMGTGSIAVRLMQALRAEGKDYFLAKYSGRKPFGLDENRHLFLPIYIVDGPDLDQRVRDASAWGEIAGIVSKLKKPGYTTLDFSLVAGVLDCADPNGTAYNFEYIYPASVPVICQGGTKLKDEWNVLPYVSAPGCKPFGKAFAGGRWKQRSCNATITSTALGLIASSVGHESIASVEVEYNRRFKDPENAGIFNPADLEIKPTDKYVKDVTDVLPELRGKMTASANKNPWQHYHLSWMDVRFTRQLDEERIREAFAGYERCILIEN
jgi:hypothetical protein